MKANWIVVLCAVMAVGPGTRTLADDFTAKTSGHWY